MEEKEGKFEWGMEGRNKQTAQPYSQAERRRIQGSHLHPYAIAIPQWTGKTRQEKSKRVASRALQRSKQGQECCRPGLWSS